MSNAIRGGGGYNARVEAARDSCLELHRPARAELGVRQGWLRDPDMMAYNAGWELQHPGYNNETGCIDWPESQWDEFLAVYQRDPAQADYFYLRDIVADEYIGHVHYKISSRGDAEIGVNIIPERRRQGWGAKAFRLLVEQIWAATSVDLIVNEFEENRRSAICLHRKIGFRPAELSEFHGVPMRRWELSRPQP